MSATGKKTVSKKSKKELPPSGAKPSDEETREAIREYEDREKQKKILEDSIGSKREYVTTNYELAKKEQTGKVTREEFEQQQEVLQVIEKTSQYLAVETDITAILEKMAETVVKGLGAERASFWDFTPDRKGAFIIAAYGIKQAYVDHSRKDPLPIGGAWLGRAMSTGQAWATSDIWKDPVLPKSWLPAVKKENYHGLLCTPLMRGNEIIGGMCIYHKDPHEYQFFEIEVMTIVSNQAATALSNARIFEDLRAEKNKTAAIIQSLRDGIIMYDLEGVVTLFNPRAQELLWVNVADIIGRKMTRELSVKDVFLKNLFHINNLVQTDYSSKEITTEGPHQVILQVTQVPVYGSGKKKIGTMHIMRDITREKEVEQLKTSFVSVASHQLRTPLSGIKWSLYTLSGENSENLNEAQKDMIEKTSDVTEYLISLVNDLLDVSRIEEGRFGYAFELGNILSALKDVISKLKANAEHRNIKVSLDVHEDELQQVSFDKRKLSLAIQNIIDNAIKYSNNNSQVKITVRPARSSLLVMVKDNGIGIPKEEQKFIFNKFFRAENAIKFQTEGSGLGLYIAKNIIEYHNGLLTFESEEGKGSTFTMQLPLDPGQMPKGSVEGL